MQTWGRVPVLVRETRQFLSHTPISAQLNLTLLLSSGQTVDSSRYVTGTFRPADGTTSTDYGWCVAVLQNGNGLAPTSVTSTSGGSGQSITLNAVSTGNEVSIYQSTVKFNSTNTYVLTVTYSSATVRFGAGVYTVFGATGITNTYSTSAFTSTNFAEFLAVPIQRGGIGIACSRSRPIAMLWLGTPLTAIEDFEFTQEAVTEFTGAHVFNNPYAPETSFSIGVETSTGDFTNLTLGVWAPPQG